MKARKYGGGIDQQITDDWSVMGELFKQEFTSQIVNDPYISEPYGLNPDKFQRLQKPVVTNRALNYSNSGTGWSHGYEIFIKKKQIVQTPKTGLVGFHTPGHSLFVTIIFTMLTTIRIKMCFSVETNNDYALFILTRESLYLSMI